MLKNGDLVGAYRIDAPLAAGGMGVVYRARHATLGHVVAIKALLPNLALKETVRLRFAQEAWVQAQLQHPGVARIIDFVQTESIHAIVMELIEGCSLEHVLSQERPGPWPLDDAMRLLRPIVAAMAYAHARKVIHRDIKPANVLMDRRGGAPWPGIPKLTDFGLARLMEATSGMTRAGTRMGTIPYMPPEQFSGRAVDARADVFALGMLARQLVTGVLPVDPDDMMAATELYSGRVTLSSVGEVVPGLPPPFIAAVDGALALDPDQRPATAGVFYKALGFGDLRLGGGSSIETQAPAAWGDAPPNDDVELADIQLPEPIAEAATAPTQGGQGVPAMEGVESEELPERETVASSGGSSAGEVDLSAPTKPSASSAVPPPPQTPWPVWLGAGIGVLGLVGGVAVYLHAASEDRTRAAEARAQAATLEAEHQRLVASAWKSLERFKTDREANARVELVEDAMRASGTAVSIDPTPEAVGLHALSTVWAHKWHYGSARWDAARFAADRALTEKATATPTPAGRLAHALLMGTGCALMPDSTSNRPATCAAVAPAYREAMVALRDGAPEWLAFEGTWTYAYVLNQAASHDWKAGARSEAEQKWRRVRSHCQHVWKGIPTALVNAPELVEECAEAAGMLQEYDQLIVAVDWLRDHAYDEDGGVPFKAFAAAYRSAHPVCHGLDLERHKRFGELSPDLARGDTERFFCYAAGLLVLDCTSQETYGAASGEGKKRAGHMPWAALEQGWRKASIKVVEANDRLLTGRSRSCALTGQREMQHNGMYFDLKGSGSPPAYGQAWFGSYATDPWLDNDFFTLGAGGLSEGTTVGVRTHTVRSLRDRVYELVFKNLDSRVFPFDPSMVGKVVGRMRPLGWNQSQVWAVEVRWGARGQGPPIVFLRK